MQVRNAAASAVVTGRPEVAYQLASALLERDSDDTEALIIKGRAARDLGQIDEALALARRGWALAKTQSEKFGASMVMAQALSTKGARTRAQLWLRRAGQNAPNAEMKAVAVRDFQFVRANNRWATELGFSAAPSSNINNGSQRSTSRLFDLPFEFSLSPTAQALSGIQYSANASTRYRLSETARYQNDVVLSFSHRTYSLSAETRRVAPSVRGNDFAFSSGSVSLFHRGFTGAGNDKPYQIDLTVGRTYYALSPFLQYGKLGITQNVPLASNKSVFFGANYEFQESLSNREDVSIPGLTAGLRRRFANQDLATFTLSGRRSHSEDASLDYKQATLGIRYAFGKPLLGMNINMGVSATIQNHDRSRFSAFGRQDKSLNGDVTAVFTNLEYFGFSPSLTLTARMNNSSIDLYDSRAVGMHVGIRSAF